MKHGQSLFPDKQTTLKKQTHMARDGSVQAWSTSSVRRIRAVWPEQMLDVTKDVAASSSLRADCSTIMSFVLAPAAQLCLFNLNATPTQVSKLRAARMELVEPTDDSNHESWLTDTHTTQEVLERHRLVGRDCIYSFR